MDMRKTVAGGVIAAVLMGVAPYSAAQIPVVDPAAIAQMVQQIVELENQLTQMKQQYAAVTGSSGFGSMLPNSFSGIANNLPQSWGNDYGASSPYAGNANATLTQFQQRIAGMTNQQAVAYVNQQRDQEGAYNQAMTQKVYNDNMAELSNLQDLTQQINQASTLKQVSDLQARIGTAQGAIQAQHEKLQALEMLQQAHAQIIRQERAMVAEKATWGNVETGDTGYTVHLGQ